MSDLANALWDNQKFVSNFAVIYRDNPMPLWMRKKKGKRGRKLRAAFARKQIVEVIDCN